MDVINHSYTVSEMKNGAITIKEQMIKIMSFFLILVLHYINKKTTVTINGYIVGSTVPRAGIEPAWS